MARKTRGKPAHEDTEIQLEPPGGEPDETGSPAQDDDPQSILDSLEPDSDDWQVRISRWERTEVGHAWVGQTVIPFEAFNPIEIGEAVGGGRIRAKVVNGKGQHKKTITFYHRSTPQVGTQAPNVGTPRHLPVQRVHGGDGEGLRGSVDQSGGRLDFAAALRDAIAPITQRLDQVERDRDRIGIKDLLPLFKPPEPIGFKEILALTQGRQDKTPIMELLGGLRELQELRGESSGGGRTETDVLPDLVDQVRQLIMDLRKPAAPVPAPALPPGQAPSDPVATLEQQLAQILTIGSTAPRADPAIYAQMIFGLTGQELLKQIVGAGDDATLIAQFTATYPQIKREFLAQVLPIARVLAATGKAPLSPGGAP